MSRVAIYRTEREMRCYRRKLRRQKEIRRNIILTIMVTFLIIFSAVSFYSITSHANADTSEVGYKYFTSIQVEKGDSLWSIAEEYIDENYYDSKSEYISEVKNINHLQDDEIISGQYLIIPYYSYEFIQ